MLALKIVLKHLEVFKKYYRHSDPAFVQWVLQLEEFLREIERKYRFKGLIFV